MQEDVSKKINRKFETLHVEIDLAIWRINSFDKDLREKSKQNLLTMNSIF